jgi:hypothetical protein
MAGSVMCSPPDRARGDHGARLTRGSETLIRFLVELLRVSKGRDSGRAPPRGSIISGRFACSIVLCSFHSRSGLRVTTGARPRLIRAVAFRRPAAARRSVRPCVFEGRPLPGVPPLHPEMI